ncbi:MAG: prolyl oligopeptidase family serine peptidase, partial [Terracidiphilus sp.]
MYPQTMRTSLLSSFVCATLCVSGAALTAPALLGETGAASHFPTTDDLRQLKAMSNPELSPDGKQALLVVADSTADGGKTHVWIVPTDGSGKARQLTFSPPADKRGERGAEWAQDGEAVFFLAHRGEHTELFRLDLRGGEAMPYTLKIAPLVDESKDKDAIPPPGAEKKDADKKDTDKKKDAASEDVDIDVAGYALSPDGKWLAVWAHDPQTPGEKKQKDEKADAEWVNHEKHGTRLYLAALKREGVLDGRLKPVAIAPDVRGAVWSPAADRLLVFTEAPNDLSDLGPAGAAWTVDAAAPEKATKLDAVPPTVGGGAWQPDGNAIVFGAATPEDAPPGCDELFALDLTQAGAKPVRLTAGFRGQVNGRDLYFRDDTVIAQAAIGTRTPVVRIPLDGKAKPAPIEMGAPVINALNTNRKQTGWLWLAEGGGQQAKLCFASSLGDACKPLQTPELAPAGLRWAAAPELVTWKSDAFTIEGLLYMPPVASSAKVPLIVDVHGGPFGAFEDRNDAFVAFLLGHGWAVLRPNPRGSSNYGVKFAAANKNDLGGGDYRDVMAGVDAVLKKYPLDANRMALMGYSYGGEMAAFVEGKTDRFKGIISMAPVI